MAITELAWLNTMEALSKSGRRENDTSLKELVSERDTALVKYTETTQEAKSQITVVSETTKARLAAGAKLRNAVLEYNAAVDASNTAKLECRVLYANRTTDKNNLKFVIDQLQKGQAINAQMKDTEANLRERRTQLLKRTAVDQPDEAPKAKRVNP